MWTDVQRQRFNHLRDREWRGTLTPEEQRELAAMMQEICDMEATYLQPATDRLQHETAQLRAELEQVLRRNRHLNTLTQRKEALLTRVQAFVAEAEAEQEALQQAYRAMMEETDTLGGG